MTNGASANAQPLSADGRAARWRWVPVLLLVAAVVAGCVAPNSRQMGDPSAGPTPGPPRELASPVREWLAGARVEGDVVVYAALDRREADELTALFARRYSGVRVGWTLAESGDLFPSTGDSDDGLAGAARFDVLVGDGAIRLTSVGLAERWSPPEAGALREYLVDPNGAWHALAITYHVVQYNTELVPGSARPRRYQDLAAPGWAGKLAAPSSATTWLKGLFEVHGRDATLAMLRPLARQDVQLADAGRSLSSLVGVGRAGLAIVNRLDAVERDRRAGAKTGWVAIEPAIVQPTVVVVRSGARHPNAARLFANFLLSADAQAALAARGRIPARRDVDPDPPNVVSGIQTHLTLPAEGAAEQELQRLYAGLWRSP